MGYVIYFVTADGRECSMPSSDASIQDDVEWILGRGHTITVIERV